MTSPILERLRNKDKKGYYQSTQTGVFYSTGYDTIDYRNSTYLKVFDDNDNIIDQYVCAGIQSGSLNLLAGEPGTGKTTLFVSMAYNMVKPFDSSFVLHFDIEQTYSMPRIKDITNMPRRDINNKYILIQEKLFLEDIHTRICEIYKDKIENKKELIYDTGLKDETNKPIKVLEPTVIILDTIKAINIGKDNLMEIEGQTSGQRKALAITQFMEKVTPMCKEANIILLMINQVKDKIEMGFSKTKSQFVFMNSNRDKVLGGGKAARYYAANVWYLDVCGKYTVEENGFSGTDIKLYLWKTRSNLAGSFAPMVFNQEKGYDNKMALYKILLENEKIMGRNPKRYIEGFPDVTFDDRILYEEMNKKEELYPVIREAALPLLEKWTSSKKLAEINTEAIDYILSGGE